jgi:5-formyltetrahydrofolate cyclo-ligase
MKKKELRRIFKESRKALSIDEIEKFNDLILINFQKLELPFLNCVHSFIPSLKLAEPDTTNIIRFLKFKNPHIKIAIPKVDIHSGNMVHYHFEDDMEMITNEFGIEEPLAGEMITEKEIEMVLVPLLAFDKRGFRVGYGKGYYDKFLARCNPYVIKIGLNFYDPVDEISDINAFDIPLDFCVTHHEIYAF